MDPLGVALKDYVIKILMRNSHVGLCGRPQRVRVSLVRAVTDAALHL